MVFEAPRQEPYRIVFQEQDTIQLRTKEGTTVTFAIDSEKFRDPYIRAAEKDNFVIRTIAQNLMPIMLIAPVEHYAETGKKADNDDRTDHESVSELARIAGVSEEEYERMARFAQKKLFDGFRQRAQGRKSERAS